MGPKSRDKDKDKDTYKMKTITPIDMKFEVKFQLASHFNRQGAYMTCVKLKANIRCR